MKKALPLLFALFLLSSFGHRQLTWVAIGDSITYLNDHRDETGNRLSQGYLTRVVKDLPYIHYINKGFNGWTSGNIAQHIDSLGLVKADVYSVFLGTNDWWQGRPIGNLADYKNNTGNATIYGSFRIIINKLRALNPEAKIVLVTPMQRVDFVYLFDKNNNAFGSYKPQNGQTLEAVANAVDSIGSYEHIPVNDLYHNPKLDINQMVKFKRVNDPIAGNYTNYKYPQFIGKPFNPATDDYPYPAEAANLTYDGLHPTDKGCTIIAKGLVKLFKVF